MEIRRNDFVYNTVSFLTRSAVRLAYTPIIVGLDNLPSSGPVLLLPKHQKYADIPIENWLLRRVSRRGNWIMKDGLPEWFKYFGGISIKRRKDFGKKIDVKDKAARRLRKREIEYGRLQNVEVMQYVEFLYNLGEDPVIAKRLEEIAEEAGGGGLGGLRLSKQSAEEL